MSNLETVSEEVVCAVGKNVGDAEILPPRAVPLAGVRAMDVRFGPYPENMPAPLPAPALPNVQLRPRG